MITVQVNDTSINIEEDCNLLQLLHLTTSSLAGIAVAINNHIVPKTQWQSQQLQSHDTVLIIKASQGG